MACTSPYVMLMTCVLTHTCVKGVYSLLFPPVGQKSDRMERLGVSGREAYTSLRQSLAEGEVWLPQTISVTTGIGSTVHLPSSTLKPKQSNFLSTLTGEVGHCWRFRVKGVVNGGDREAGDGGGFVTGRLGVGEEVTGRLRVGEEEETVVTGRQGVVVHSPGEPRTQEEGMQVCARAQGTDSGIQILSFW